MRQDNGDYGQWLEAALALSAQKNAAVLRQFLTFRHQKGQSSGKLAFDLCQIALLQGEAALVNELALQIEAADPFFGAFQVTCGYLALADDDLDRGVALVRQGFAHLQAVSRRFPFEALPPEDLGVIGLVAFLFEREDWVLVGPAPMAETPLLSLLHANPSAVAAPLTFAAFADSAYFLRYVGPLVASLRQNGPASCAIHLCVVNPDAAALALAGDLAAGQSCRISAVAFDGQPLAEFSAAARFLHANAILEQAGGPVIFLDADSIIPSGAEDVLRQIASYPLSWIGTGEMPPQLLIAASVVGAHPGPQATRFFDVAARYLRRKLCEDGPLWTFDQVALHRAVASLRRQGGQGVDLSSALGPGWSLPGAFVARHQTALAERRQARTNSQFGYRGLDGEGRPMWTRLSQAGRS